VTHAAADASVGARTTASALTTVSTAAAARMRNLDIGTPSYVDASVNITAIKKVS
jgi:hypothetical protein